MLKLWSHALQRLPRATTFTRLAHTKDLNVDTLLHTLLGRNNAKCELPFGMEQG